MPNNSRFAMALHMIVVLARRKDEFVSSSYIAHSVNTNPVVIRRVLALLIAAKIVATEKGKKGGYRLRKCPSEISLWDVYKALGEEHLFATHQNPINVKCPVSCNMKQALKTVFGRAEKAAQAELKKITLQCLVGDCVKK